MRVVKRVPKSALLEIVGDGAISSRLFADGRLLPVIIVDCEGHQGMREAIQVHKFQSIGDISSAWGRVSKYPNSVVLFMDLLRPIATSAVVLFDVETQGILVSSILASHGIYLQPLSSGRTVSEGIDNPKIVVEVPEADFDEKWESIYRTAIRRRFRREGLRGKNLTNAVNEFLDQVDSLARARLGR